MNKLNLIKSLFSRKNPMPAPGTTLEYVEENGIRAYRPRRLDVAKVDGAMYWEPSNVERVKTLKREGKLKEAERLLLRLVEATCKEDEQLKWGVAPWYFEQLAIVYRKMKEIDKEIKILEKYAQARHAPGVTPQKLVERLEKAKSIRTKMGK